LVEDHHKHNRLKAELPAKHKKQAQLQHSRSGTQG